MSRIRWLVLALATALASPVQAGVDSYRFLHVTIATPWYIFLFLLIGVFSPFILMACLMWRAAIQKGNNVDDDSDQPPSSD